MNGRPDTRLQELAHAAGLKSVWQDARGQEQHVSAETLRLVLETLGFACQSVEQCRESMARLESLQADVVGVEIVRVGDPVVLRRQGSLHYQLSLEDGTRIMGTARDLGGGRVAIPAIRKPGYHQLNMGSVHCTLAVFPAAPLDVAALLSPHVDQAGAGRGATPHAGSRPWVLGAQVYGLRRGPPKDSGAPRIDGWQAGGDYALLGSLAEAAGRAGAAGLAISPVHAMFAADAQRYSPYAPSSRLFLNVLLADPECVFEQDVLQCLDYADDASFVDDSGRLNWSRIQERRLSQLQRLFERFDAGGPPGLREDFQRFSRQGGEALHSHACYEALHAHFAASLGPAHGWREWPQEYHDPEALAVRHFAEKHAREVRFHGFLQWLAARSLDAAQKKARAHTSLGLIADMAVGTDPRGSHAWSRQTELMTEVSVGAPPDIFQPEGQDWGLTAFSPWGLRQHGYAGYIETLRAALAHAGGVRVDHVIGLERLWLVPKGLPASHGVYLGYPKKDLMNLLLLEAWRHRALVVGENLGTVPQGFDDEMAHRGFLGMNVLWFEREDGNPPRFRRPEEWPSASMAMLTTHDLPTARGWWQGRDIEWRERHHELNAEQVAEHKHLREQEKLGLWRALQEVGLVGQSDELAEEAPVKEMLGFLARTPAALVHIALEDLTGQQDQPNLPGPPPSDLTQAHPNWCRTLSTPVDQLLSTEPAPTLLEALNGVTRNGVTRNGVRPQLKPPQIKLGSDPISGSDHER